MNHFLSRQRHLPLITTAVVLVVLFASASLLFRNFASPLVVANIFRNNAYLGVLAIGMTLVIVSGGIDLSVGTVLAFATVLIAKLVSGGTHPLAAMLAAMAVTTLFGAGMGALIHCFRLPPFLVTLAGMFLAKGMAFVVHMQSLAVSSDWFTALARFEIRLPGNAPLTAGTLILLFLLAVAAVIAHFTAFGRNVYAVGGSENSAVLMGLPVGRTRIGVYAFSGFCAGLGGVVYLLGTPSGNPAMGLGMELEAIACAVIGGTLLTGGVGYVLGTLLGFLIYGTIKTALDFAGNLGSSDLRIAMGLLLLVFIVLQRVLAGRAADHR